MSSVIHEHSYGFSILINIYPGQNEEWVGCHIDLPLVYDPERWIAELKYSKKSSKPSSSSTVSP